MKTLVSVALPVGITAASILLLHRIKAEEWLPPPSEILNAPPEEALFGVVWLLAFTLTAWIVVTTLLSVVAYATGISGAIRAVEWVTLPLVRRLGRRWAGLLLAVGSMTMALPVGATVVPPIPLVVGSHQPGAADTDSAVAPPASTGVASAPPAVPSQANSAVAPPASTRTVSAPPAVRSGAADIEPEKAFPDRIGTVNAPPFLSGQASHDDPDGPAGAILYTVRPGDNLWSITASHIAGEGDGAPSPARIVPLWLQVISLNQERLRSSDPDLIFPGEKILLPPLPARSGD